MPIELNSSNGSEKDKEKSAFVFMDLSCLKTAILIYFDVIIWRDQPEKTMALCRRTHQPLGHCIATVAGFRRRWSCVPLGGEFPLASQALGHRTLEPGEMDWIGGFFFFWGPGL